MVELVVGGVEWRNDISIQNKRQRLCVVYILLGFGPSSVLLKVFWYLIVGYRVCVAVRRCSIR